MGGGEGMKGNGKEGFFLKNRRETKDIKTEEPNVSAVK